jgi:hypothetical protein
MSRSAEVIREFRDGLERVHVAVSSGHLIRMILAGSLPLAFVPLTILIPEKSYSVDLDIRMFEDKVILPIGGQKALVLGTVADIRECEMEEERRTYHETVMEMRAFLDRHQDGDVSVGDASQLISLIRKQVAGAVQITLRGESLPTCPGQKMGNRFRIENRNQLNAVIYAYLEEKRPHVIDALENVHRTCIEVGFNRHCTGELMVCIINILIRRFCLRSQDTFMTYVLFSTATNEQLYDMILDYREMAECVQYRDIQVYSDYGSTNLYIDLNGCRILYQGSLSEINDRATLESKFDQLLQKIGSSIPQIACENNTPAVRSLQIVAIRAYVKRFFEIFLKLVEMGHM